MDNAQLRSWADGLRAIPGSEPLRAAVLRLLDLQKVEGNEREKIADGAVALMNLPERLRCVEHAVAALTRAQDENVRRLAALEARPAAKRGAGR